MAVDDVLAEWLIDNTEKVFEEEPEVDEARGIVNDVHDAMVAVNQEESLNRRDIEIMQLYETPKDQIKGIKSAQGILQDRIDQDGFEDTELEDAIEILGDVITGIESTMNDG
jgi:hypothetical protein